MSRTLTRLLLAGMLAGNLNLLAADLSAVSSAETLAKAEASAKAEPTTPAWTGFRGPEGTGVWPNAKPPTTWDGEDTGDRLIIK